MKDIKEQFNVEDFNKEYKELCMKYGCDIMAIPIWMHKEDGTFGLVIQYHIRQLPKDIQTK
jgi:hypothetical protein